MFVVLFCVFCVFVLFCILFLPMYIVVYFLFVYSCANHCHWGGETQLQLINIISYHIWYYYFLNDLFHSSVWQLLAYTSFYSTAEYCKGSDLVHEASTILSLFYHQKHSIRQRLYSNWKGVQKWCQNVCYLSLWIYGLRNIWVQ